MTDAIGTPAVAAPAPSFRRGAALAARLHDLVPGGSHTYSKGDDQFPELSPRLMARAQGAWTWDVDGNRFLDWAMGVRAVVLGHAWEPVDRAVKRTIDGGVHFTRPSLLELELAEYLVDLLPVAEMVKFGKNGSDVTTAAMKLARAYTGRELIACCEDHPFFSIHDWFIATTPVNAGVPADERRRTLGFRYNDFASVERLFAEHPGRIAAVILEPVRTEPPRDDFLRRLRDLTEREGAILVFDEMVTGVRFDLRGAHHRYGVYPDLATYGKAIANGYSFALLAGRRELMELGGLRHAGRRVFLLSQTHGAEATGLAACRATLDECRRLDVTSHIWSLGGRLAEATRQMVREAGLGAHVRVTGFDCNPQIQCTREDGRPWPALHTAFHETVIAHGVLAPWISVTWSHHEPELALTLDAFRHGLERVARAVEAGDENAGLTGPAARPVFRAYNRCQQSRCGRLDPAAPRLACCEAPTEEA